ncbi:hypothetical protein Trydic_g18265 [Trypoxylus dichotomus]
MLRKKLKLSTPEDAKVTSEIANEPLGLSNKYFNNQNSDEDIPTTLLKYAVALNEKLNKLLFGSPVQYIYNPVEYAYDMHASFIKKFCNNEKKILLLGMNPGPWGMVQTGVPFGEIKMVKEWYKIQAKINKPAIECPERQIMGLDCHRSEISGKRLYEFFKKISDTPENFFRNTYLYNYCPLALMEKGGRNVTPSSLKGAVKKELEEYCNNTLMQVLSLLKTEIIVALGVYAKTQAESILRAHNVENIEVICMPHPSPRAKGNENWGEKAQKSSSKAVLNTSSFSESEKKFMEIAFQNAQDALKNQEVPVGCIFVYNNEIIAQGRNTVNETHNATRHAEMNCIDDVILFGCRNDRFGGQTVFDVRSVLNPVTVVKDGYRADDAMALLKEFYKGTNPSAPSSKVKIKSVDKKAV